MPVATARSPPDCSASILGPTHLARCLRTWRGATRCSYVHASYSDRFVDIMGGVRLCERVGYLNDSNLIARRVGPVMEVVASPTISGSTGSRDAG